MRGSQKHNSDCGLADTVVPLFNGCLKQRLFNHYSAERMPDEYKRSTQLINLLALVDQAAKQTLSIIYDVCSGVPKCCIGVVSKCHHPSIRHVLWKKVFEPEGICLGARPSVLRVSVQAMNRNDIGIDNLGVSSAIGWIQDL